MLSTTFFIRRAESACRQYRAVRWTLLPETGLRRCGMRTAGEGGLSLVSASRAAVPHPPAHFADAMPPHVSRCHIASRLQLRLADGKNLLGVNSVRSARQAAQNAEKPTESKKRGWLKKSQPQSYGTAAETAAENHFMPA